MESRSNGINFPAYASFGVSASRWSCYDLRQLLAHADSALYLRKRDLRNCVAVHDDQSEATELLLSGKLDRRRSQQVFDLLRKRTESCAGSPISHLGSAGSAGSAFEI